MSLSSAAIIRLIVPVMRRMNPFPHTCASYVTSGRFRREAETQIALHRLRLHVEAERRRRLVARDADRGVHDAISSLAGLLP